MSDTNIRDPEDDIVWSCHKCNRDVDVSDDTGGFFQTRGEDGTVTGPRYFYCDNCLREQRSHYRCPSCDSDQNIGQTTFSHYDVFVPLTRKWVRKPAPEPMFECFSCEYHSHDADEWEYPSPLETT